FQHTRGNSAERLVVGHEVKVDIGLNAKDVHDLIEHLAVLRRRDQDGLELVSAILQFKNDRRQLDGFRTRAKHNPYQWTLKHGSGVSLLVEKRCRSSNAGLHSACGNIYCQVNAMFI